MKRIFRFILNTFNINTRYGLTPGITIFGYNFYKDVRPGKERFRSSYALDYMLHLRPKRVLDVGSGAGHHAIQFTKNGSSVVCVDFGTSVYAKSKDAQNKNLEVININFNEFNSEVKFDLVWASHVLEHQRNVGSFLEKLISLCSDDGRICITVPDPHRNLWGGHLTQWSPGLLAYNIILCGIDLTDAVFIRGTNEFTICFPLKKASIFDLTFDSGDIDKLSNYFPQGMVENSDPWNIKYKLD